MSERSFESKNFIVNIMGLEFLTTIKEKALKVDKTGLDIREQLNQKMMRLRRITWGHSVKVAQQSLRVVKVVKTFYPIGA